MTIELSTREVGAGRPVVLLHAFPLSSAMWLGQREGLSAVCHVLTPDQRGFGASTDLGTDDPSLDRCADDLAALLDARGLDTVVLGGLSMGGYVAMAFLRRHPGRVQALLLADTKASADAEPAVAHRLAIAERVLAEGSDALLDTVFPSLLGDTTALTRPAVVARVRGLVQAAPPASVAWAQRAMAARSDCFDVLRETDVPALVVVGDEDKISSLADAEAMVAALPQGQLHVLPNAGHLTAVETPETFTGAVLELLRGL